MRAAGGSQPCVTELGDLREQLAAVRGVVASLERTFADEAGQLEARALEAELLRLRAQVALDECQAQYLTVSSHPAFHLCLISAACRR